MPEARHDAGAEALEHDVGAAASSRNAAAARGRLQVDPHPLDAAPAAVGAERRARSARPACLGGAPTFTTARRSRRGCACSAPPARPSRGRARVMPSSGAGGEARSSDRSEVLRQAELAARDDVLLDLRGAAADRVDHGRSGRSSRSRPAQRRVVRVARAAARRRRRRRAPRWRRAARARSRRACTPTPRRSAACRPSWRRHEAQAEHARHLALRSTSCAMRLAHAAGPRAAARRRARALFT